MIEQTSEVVQESYVPFLIRIAKLTTDHGRQPFLLIHESQRDVEIARQVANHVAGIQIVTEDSPLRIKGIVGACFATIGSRFHGLVSALSQGVPSFGTGWSHKYQQLFEEYEFPKGMLEVTSNDEDLVDRLKPALQIEQREQIASRLRERANVLRSDVQTMWEEVFSMIEAPRA
jgi:colanic acid/amylovoran biosynthesis protein